MSDNIPLEIQLEIIKRLPIKSLLQFRSVSKAWKSLIDASDFIAHYSNQMQHLLVTYVQNFNDNDRKYVSVADDDTFPQKKVSLTLPLSLRNPVIIGNSHGLLCLFGSRRDGRRLAVLWNPSIRKAVAVAVPHWVRGTVLGFGVCGETNDPKIIRIRHDNSWQVDVFTLSTGAWRRLCDNLPGESIRFSKHQEEVDGFLYWLATDQGGRCWRYNLIISFDVTKEKFKQVNLPDRLACMPGYDLSISKLMGSLVVLERNTEANKVVWGVWLIPDGNYKAFTKMFNVRVKTSDDLICTVKGFRDTEEAIIELMEDDSAELVAYDPYSKRRSNLGFYVIDGTFDVYSYFETLLLLDQPNLVG